MSDCLRIHPTHPQLRLVDRAADVVRTGGVVVFPTDSTYAIGCHLGDKQAVERIRAVRRLPVDHHFTLMCRDLSALATYARVDNTSYRIVRRYLPGPFTFVLPATREVPRRLVHKHRRTIGLRVPDHPIAQALLDALGEPMMSTTLLLPGEELPVADVEDRCSELLRIANAVIDGGVCGAGQTTVVDLTSGELRVVRQGTGML